MVDSHAIARVARGVGKGPRRYRARAEYLFDGIPLSGRRVLDVGCGAGTYSLWAGLNGAEYVLGIEPELDGSRSGFLSRFRELIRAVGLDDVVEARSQLYQNLDPADGTFDVVLMYNVINHLDEDAVQVLHTDPAAVDRYHELLADLPRLLKPGGYLVLADSSRTNFWNQLGVRSPVAPTIEWAKHQEPERWAEVLAPLGFEVHDLRWSPWYPLTRITANRLVQYLTGSHWVLRLRHAG